MSLRRRFGALPRMMGSGLLASALVISCSTGANAATVRSAAGANTAANPLVAKALAVAEAPNGKLSAAADLSAADNYGDASASADIVGSSLHFDTSTIGMQVTVSEPNLDPANDSRWMSGNYGLAVFLSFNHSDAIDAVMVYGGDGLGHLVSIGQNQYFSACDVSTSISASPTGSVFSMTTPASCYYHPGAIAYSVMYGDFAAASNGDVSNIDLSPDNGGFSDTVAEPGGYWLLGQDGGIFTFGDAKFYGSTGNLKLNQPVVAMSSMPQGDGYRFVAADGGVFSYGNAGFWGSTGSMKLNKPVVGMATTPSGNGYWLVASDGGIFAFGDAEFWGSTGSLHLNKPIVAMTPTASGHGYWLVASDGGIFAFGDASFHGSAGGKDLDAPVTSMAATKDGNGYYILLADGSVFAFDAPFYGSASNEAFGETTGIIAGDSGYRITDNTGGVYEYGSMYHYGDLIDLNVWPNSPIVGMASK